MDLLFANLLMKDSFRGVLIVGSFQDFAAKRHRYIAWGFNPRRMANTNLLSSNGAQVNNVTISDNAANIDASCALYRALMVGRLNTWGLKPQAVFLCRFAAKNDTNQ